MGVTSHPQTLPESSDLFLVLGHRLGNPNNRYGKLLACENIATYQMSFHFWDLHQVIGKLKSDSFGAGNMDTIGPPNRSKSH